MANSLAFFYRLPLFAVCALVIAPILVLLSSWAFIDTSLWQHLWQTQLAELLINTLILVAGVGLMTGFLGVTLAWLTAVCDFPGRRFFDWALILPLAIPTYVLAFVTLGVYDFAGPVQTMLRSVGFQGFIDARQPLMVVWVMAAVLYPYVYLLVRAAFLSQGIHLFSVARTLGRSPSNAFFQASLPAVRPALVAGMALALMEALADFGAVSIFGYNTFTTAIYKSWLSLFSLHTAAQLATLLLLFVILCLMSEKSSRKNLIENNRCRSSNQERIRLSGKWKYLATFFCALVLLLTLLLPLTQLVGWAYTDWKSAFAVDFLRLVLNTFCLGLAAALIVVGLSVLISTNLPGTAAKKNKTFWLTEIAGLGYALPGSVLAIGIMLCLSMLDAVYLNLGQWLGQSWQPVLLGSLTGLLLAYVIRFFRPGFGSVQTGFSAVHNNYTESAQLMGLSGWQRFIRVTVPLVMPGILTGALIVFVDVIKEMPASLLLRPFGWDTLAIKLYELTSEGEWERAAVPALTLVLVSLVPVIMLIRQSQNRPSSPLPRVKG